MAALGDDGLLWCVMAQGARALEALGRRQQGRPQVGAELSGDRLGLLAVVVVAPLEALHQRPVVAGLEIRTGEQSISGLGVVKTPKQ